MQPILATSAAVITPHDTNPNVFNAIYVGGTGNITLIDLAGNSVLISAIPAGTILPIACTLVMATGTTATLLVGLNW